MKAIPLLYLARHKKMVFFIDSVICGAAVGGGFSILENIFYLVLGEPMGMGTVLFRGLEVALIHMGCSAIVAAGLMFAVRMAERRRSRLEVKRKDVLMAVFLLVAAPALHVSTIPSTLFLCFSTLWSSAPWPASWSGPTSTMQI